MQMRSAAIVVCVFALMVLCPGRVEAHTTICDLREAVRFGYGTKINAIVWVPREKGAAFRSGIDAFFERSRYLVGTVSSGDPDDPRGFWDQLPQSPSLDIAFKIETRKDRDFALVELTTFSFDCGATEDWRPHWYKFRDYLRASEFKPFVAWTPLNPSVSQMVGGDFNTPLWFVIVRNQIKTFAPWLRR